MNNSPLLRRLGVVTAFCMALTVFACKSDKGPVSPVVQPEITNMSDDFQFQMTVDDYTATMRYNWQTTATIVNVDQSCAITDGGGTLIIRDNAGTVVYGHDLGAGGSFQTDPGEAGTWQLEVSLTSTTGELNFRAQKNQ